MAQLIDIVNFTLPAGPFAFGIDGIPATSVGFEIILDRSPDFDAAGRVFLAQLFTRSAVGQPLVPWHEFWLDGGPAFARDGSPIQRHRWAFGWPGDWTGMVRTARKQVEVQLSGTVFRAFTSPRLIVRHLTVLV